MSSPPPTTPGLCARCAFGRRIESPKGSVFWRCLHPELPKYPRLPVLSCRGHEPEHEPVGG